MTAKFAFVDGAVNVNRKRTDGGADFGAYCAVAFELDSNGIIGSFRIEGHYVDKRHLQLHAGLEIITNSTMELKAVERGCAMSDWNADATFIWTDSKYAQGCLSLDSSWKLVENVELIRAIEPITKKQGIYILHVPGHSGIAWNELANKGCTEVLKRRRGFSGKRTCRIGLCAFCGRFACFDTRFGKETSVLVGQYGPCEQFIPFRGEYGPLERYVEGLDRLIRGDPVDQPKDSGVKRPTGTSGPEART